MIRDVYLNFFSLPIITIITLTFIITHTNTQITTATTTTITNLTTTIAPSADWKTVTITIEMDDDEGLEFLASLDSDKNGNITLEEVLDREKKSEIFAKLESVYSFYDWAPRLPTWLDPPPALVLNRLEPEFILDGVPDSANHKLKFLNAVGVNHSVMDDGVVTRVYTFSYLDNSTGRWWAIPPNPTNATSAPTIISSPNDYCQTVSLWALNSVDDSQAAHFVAPAGWVVHAVNGTRIPGNQQEVYIPASAGVFNEYWNVTFRPSNMSDCPRNCKYTPWNCSLYSTDDGCIAVNTFKFSRTIISEAEPGGWPCIPNRTDVLTGNDFRPNEFQYCRTTQKRGIAGISGNSKHCNPVENYIGYILAVACIVIVSVVVFLIVRSALKQAH